MEIKKKNLEQLLLFITEICKDDQNDWFKNELLLTLGNNTGDSKTVERIYEYCVKKIINDQANKFYESFKIKNIKESLILDFVRMEHFKREDNFEDFCLAMYQQIENIVNYIFNVFDLSSKVSNDSSTKVISRYDRATKLFVRDQNGNSIGNFIFLKRDSEPLIDVNSQTWFYNNKFRAVLYYFYFNKTIKYNYDLFNSLYNIGNEIYIMRNLNHRGSIPSDYQKKVYDKINPHYNNYYFKFLGFLEDFVSGINKNLPEIK